MLQKITPLIKELDPLIQVNSTIICFCHLARRKMPHLPFDYNFSCFEEINSIGASNRPPSMSNEFSVISDSFKELVGSTRIEVLKSALSELREYIFAPAVQFLHVIQNRLNLGGNWNQV